VAAVPETHVKHKNEAESSVATRAVVIDFNISFVLLVNLRMGVAAGRVEIRGLFL